MRKRAFSKKECVLTWQCFKCLYFTVLALKSKLLLYWLKITFQGNPASTVKHKNLKFGIITLWYYVWKIWEILLYSLTLRINFTVRFGLTIWPAEETNILQLECYKIKTTAKNEI